jgi:methionine synthase I (cobalamin-dependent)
MKTPLLDIVRTRPLIGDGAMGTQLMLAGLEQGGCGEAWNLTHPDRCSASSAATPRRAGLSSPTPSAARGSC